MARTSTALQQAMLILEILKRLPQHGFVTAEELVHSLTASGFNVRLLTVQRALKALREDSSMCIECNDRSRPYGYKLSTTQNMALARPTPEQSLLLQLVQTHLRNQLPPVLTKALEPLYKAAKNTLSTDTHRQKERAWLKKVAVIPNSILFEAPYVSPRIFRLVTEALYAGLKLRLRYHNMSGAQKEKIVSPLGLVQQDVRLYLVCCFDGYDDIRQLALHRMEDATVLNTPARIPQKFNLQRYIAEKPFNYSYENTRLIHLTLELTNPETIANLKETPFNQTQAITQLADTTWRVEVDIHDSLLLEGWINTWRDVAGIYKVKKEAILSDNGVTSDC